MPLGSTPTMAEELAERIGMAQPAISRLESGFGPRGPETIMRYVHGCNAQGGGR